MPSFYNTPHLDGAELAAAVVQATRQQDAIMVLFTNHSRTFTPSQMKRTLHRYGMDWPITSVRRAMTNLAKDGKLEKTPYQAPGPLGKPEYIWQSSAF